MSKEELTQITDLVTDNTLFCTKEVLTSDEAADTTLQANGQDVLFQPCRVGKLAAKQPSCNG